MKLEDALTLGVGFALGWYVVSHRAKTGRNV